MNMKKILSIILFIGLIAVISSSFAFAGDSDGGILSNGATFTVPSGYTVDTSYTDSGVMMVDSSADTIIIDSDVSDSSVEEIEQEGYTFKSKQNYNIAGNTVEEQVYESSDGIDSYGYYFEKNGESYVIVASTSGGSWNVQDTSNPVNEIISTLEI